MESLLEIRNLNVSYQVDGRAEHHAVSDVSFAIMPGETVGLMGESGCGKTSIAMAVLGLLSKKRATVSGSVRFRGKELLSLDENSLQKVRGAEISLVFQEPGVALSPFVRVGAQVAEVLHAHRPWAWHRCRLEAELMLTRLGLEEPNRIYAAYPHQLSGGQRQRVLLAQALICQPALLIADEPTSALDACAQSELLKLLQTLGKELQSAILLISHSPEIHASLTDRLLVMSNGKIIEQGTFAEVYESARNSQSKAILGAAPVFARSENETRQPTSAGVLAL